MKTNRFFAVHFVPIQVVALLAIVLTSPEQAHSSAPNGAWHLEADAPSHIFPEPDPVTFHSADGSSLQIEWVLRDWLGNDVAHGMFRVTPAAPLQLPALDPGYYTLYYDAINPQSKPGENSPSISFARVADPTQRKITGYCPYGIDVPQNSVSLPQFYLNPSQPASTNELTSQLAQWAGVELVRDRIDWAWANPQAGQYNWERADLDTNLLTGKGIQTVKVIHDAPAWVKTGGHMVPSDLLALYHFTRAAALHFKGRVAAWEFWDELDNASCPDSAWEFAAAQKAAFIGFTDGDPGAKVLIPAEHNSPISAFYELVLRNGIEPYFDLFNFHFYKPLDELPKAIDDKARTLAENRIKDKPVWMTEFGLADEGAGRQFSLIPGRNLLEHDALQELQQADFLVKGFITAQSYGVACSFYHTLAPMNDGQDAKVWGLLRWDWTAKPAYAALSNLTFQLGDMVYRGRVSAGKGVTAHLFETPSSATLSPTQTVVAWAESETEVELPGNETKFSVVDAMGRPSAISGKGLVASTLPIYITGLHDLRPESLFIPPRITARPPQSRLDFKIVLSIHFEPGPNAVKRTHIELKPGQMSIGTLWAYNFSNASRTVRLISVIEGAEVQGLPLQVAIPPFSAVKNAFTILKVAGSKRGGQFALSATSERGEVTAVVVPFK